LKQVKKQVKKQVSVVVALLLIASCASLTGDNDSGVMSGVGRIPGYDFGTAITLPAGFELDLPDLQGGLIGTKAGGNRLLMIGDSIMASTAKRYGNEMCNALVPLGWQVAIEAEASRFAEFGVRVLDKRMNAESGWDAAVVFLGSNYEGNKESYGKQMRKIVEKLTPRPILLVNTSLFRNTQREVNQEIDDLALDFENVSILDWATISKSDGVLAPDGVHLSKNGRSIFAVAIARALDIAPFREGECLDSKFRDDSAAGKGVMPSAGEVIDDSSTQTTIAGVQVVSTVPTQTTTP
jgi:hypothetical protein